MFVVFLSIVPAAFDLKWSFLTLKCLNCCPVSVLSSFFFPPEFWKKAHNAQLKQGLCLDTESNKTMSKPSS